MKIYFNFKNLFICLITTVLVTGGIVFAGSLTPLTSSPESTYVSLNDIYEKLTTGATTTEKSFLPISNTDTATMHTLSEIFDSIYDVDVLQTVEPNLIENNIVSGITIFGIEGSYEGDSTPLIVWADADESGTMLWQPAHDACADKTDGGYVWRLPTSSELHQLYVDNLGTPSGFQNDSYWSGVTHQSDPNLAYVVDMIYGDVYSDYKVTYSNYVRCVRSFDGGGGAGGA